MKSYILENNLCTVKITLKNCKRNLMKVLKEKKILAIEWKSTKLIKLPKEISDKLKDNKWKKLTKS